MSETTPFWTRTGTSTTFGRELQAVRVAHMLPPELRRRVHAPTCGVEDVAAAELRGLNLDEGASGREDLGAVGVAEQSINF